MNDSVGRAAADSQQRVTLRYLPQSQPRDQWHTRRVALERANHHHGPHSPALPAHQHLLRLLSFALKFFGLYGRGLRNALDISASNHTLAFDDLPLSFDGYRILHVTDPHFDALPGITDRLVPILRDHPADFCILTGDYQALYGGPHEHILGDLRALIDAVEAPDGLVATLGNHDSAAMADSLEVLGVTVLANEIITLTRGSDEIVIAGIDDVHYFYSDASLDVLQSAPHGFKIAAVHSAELADHAAQAGYRFYLCGHTHAGQIALPNGQPLVTYLSRMRHLSHGFWNHDGMIGYTSSGVGTVSIPVRYFTQPEVTVFTLQRSTESSSTDAIG